MADYFVHSHGIVEPGAQIGARTRVWAFAHVLPGARIGEDCNVCDGVFVENDVTIGDRVTIKGGVQVWDGITLEDDVFVGPNATFTNDNFPRSKHYPDQFARTHVKKGASIGANATILPGMTIGQFAMVGAGAVVSKDVPPNAIAMGVPARVVGFVDPQGKDRLEACAADASASASELTALGVMILRVATGAGGNFEARARAAAQEISFAVGGYSIVQDVPPDAVMGGSAQKARTQFLICARGSCHAVIEDGRARSEVRLDAAGAGALVPPLRWVSLYKFSSDAVLMIFSSNEGAADVREYETFLSLVGAD